jgi:tRNA-Thr(GGU) m(6)t(6)A37 methyltransferase TsaA
METITHRPIGVIRTPFLELEGMPVQAAGARGIAGWIDIDPALEEGLADLGGFSHVILLYHLHRVGAPKLTVTPFLDTVAHGVFATRSPARPNPIGLSTVRLTRVAGTRLDIEDVDILDGTPLLDLKPYVPALDDRADPRIGWYEGKLARIDEVRADRRFA